MASTLQSGIWKRLRWIGAVVALTLAATGGCGTDEKIIDGGGDRPDNGIIAIDESALVGTVEGQELRIDVPVKALTKSARGSLNVALVEVDGKTKLEQRSVSYDALPGSTQHLTATFAVPAGVTEQADWVKTNVRIDDGTTQGLRVTASLLRVVSPYDIKLEGPQNAVLGKTAKYRVHAESAYSKKPIVGLSVKLLLKKGDTVAETSTLTTNALGDAVFAVNAPASGDFSVLCEVATQGTKTELSGGVAVAEPGKKVLLTTDKPLYQPGQVIHLRTLALAPPQNTPLAGEQVSFEIEDGKGNKIFKRDVQTDSYGIAFTDFALGQILNMGTFKVRSVVGQTATEKTVEVTRYALPKFKTGVSLDKPWYLAGDLLMGTLSAGYFFGKPVASADVVIEGISVDVGETVFAKVVGKTNASGDMSFSLKLPSSLVGLPLEQGNALLYVRTTVTDSAGQEVKKDTAVSVAESAVRVVLVPEATALVPQVENHLSLFVTDPLGAPIAGAKAELDLGGKSAGASTDAWGFADVAFVPPAGGSSVTVTVTPSSGGTVKKSFDFSSQSGAEHVLVRTDKSVYAVGESIKVQVISTAASARAYVDWLNQGQTVDMRTLELGADGTGSFVMPVDASLLGTNRVQAYVVDSDGNVVRAGRTLFARTDSTLNVSLSTDKPLYAPGAPAKLTFSVTDETGKPTPAALGVQVVDEALYALVDAKPGLLKTYFQLEDAYAEPKYEIMPPPGSLPDLLFDKTSSKDPAAAEAAQNQAAATLAALGGAPITGLSLSSFAATQAKAITLLAPYFEAERERLLALLVPIAKSASESLKVEGCVPESYYCEKLGKDYYQAFGERVQGRLMAFDFWGNAYSEESQPYDYTLRYRSFGPDEKSGSADDQWLSVSYYELAAISKPGGMDAGTGGATGFGGAGGGGAWGGAAGSSAGGGGTGATEEGPRVRQDFPETLYVNPNLITGADGKASVSLDMADSITEWRVTTLAHSSGGKLGGGSSGITVFQDFFADVSFPATLTRGDEVDFPIAVYNYLGAAQDVKLELQPGSWYTPLGATTKTVSVQPGQVVGVRFPVRVNTVGLQTLTVKATGQSAADAVARKVLVVPDGKLFSTAVSGALAVGTAKHGVSFPANAVPGSPQMFVEIYPAFLSQVVSGMDSMLQVPNGCFEQTTSTTWPNVLVTRYMTQTSQITPAIQMKAESLISAGYQRLLTFEHQGGGFSWFGEQDPKPYLSVTAFGLMEFADMAKVHPVDPAMLARTQSWLLGQQKGDGSWEGDQTEFFSFQTSVLRNTAFVIWALASNGYKGPELAKAIAFAKTKLGSDEDAYTLGLVANAFAAAAPNDPATSGLLATLDGKKKVDGKKIHWDSAGTQTNFYGAGDDAAVTATALVAHAFLLSGSYKSSVEGALEYLVGSKDSQGNFGSTQATIWTLRTLILAAEKGTQGAVGSFSVAVDGAPFTTVELTADKPDVMTTVDLGALATLGSHEISLSFTGTGKVSYNVVARHHLPWAEVPAEPTGPLSVSVSYDKTSLALNDSVLATVSVVNNTASVQNMVILTLGIPPGFAVDTADLDAEKKSGKLSSYELTGKQLTLYLSALAGSATETFKYHLLATMPVKASDGGAQAYLYYEPEKKTSAASTTLVVTE